VERRKRFRANNLIDEKGSSGRWKKWGKTWLCDKGRKTTTGGKPLRRRKKTKRAKPKKKQKGRVIKLGEMSKGGGGEQNGFKVSLGKKEENQLQGGPISAKISCWQANSQTGAYHGEENSNLKK